MLEPLRSCQVRGQKARRESMSSGASLAMKDCSVPSGHFIDYPWKVVITQRASLMRILFQYKVMQENWALKPWRVLKTNKLMDFLPSWECFRWGWALPNHKQLQFFSLKVHAHGSTPWALGPANSATHSYVALCSGCPLAGQNLPWKMHRSHGMLTIDHQKHAQLDVVHIHTSCLTGRARLTSGDYSLAISWSLHPWPNLYSDPTWTS